MAATKEAAPADPTKPHKDRHGSVAGFQTPDTSVVFTEKSYNKADIQSLRLRARADFLSLESDPNQDDQDDPGKHLQKIQA